MRWVPSAARVRDRSNVAVLPLKVSGVSSRTSFVKPVSVGPVLVRHDALIPRHRKTRATRGLVGCGAPSASVTVPLTGKASVCVTSVAATNTRVRSVSCSVSWGADPADSVNGTLVPSASIRAVPPAAKVYVVIVPPSDPSGVIDPPMVSLARRQLPLGVPASGVASGPLQPARRTRIRGASDRATFMSPTITWIATTTFPPAGGRRGPPPDALARGRGKPRRRRVGAAGVPAPGVGSFRTVCPIARASAHDADGAPSCLDGAHLGPVAVEVLGGRPRRLGEVGEPGAGAKVGGHGAPPDVTHLQVADAGDGTAAAWEGAARGHE